jgi:long-chain acyl-CoA synthetase
VHGRWPGNGGFDREPEAVRASAQGGFDGPAIAFFTHHIRHPGAGRDDDLQEIKCRPSGGAKTLENSNNRRSEMIVRERHFGDRDVLCFADRPANVSVLLENTIASHPDREAIVTPARRVTYRELGELVKFVARGFRDEGIVVGDRVAVLLKNRLEFVVASLAVIRIGAIAVPINIREQTDELAYILNDSGAVALVHEQDLIPRLPAPERVPSIARRFAVGDSTDGAGSFQALLVGAGDVSPPHEAREEDTAVLLYTSGTTGHPKGAMLTHLNIVHSTLHYQLCFDLGPEDRSMLVVPASHVTGVVAIILTMIRSGGCVIMMEAFNAPTFMETAARERMTHTILVPAMYNLSLMRTDFEAYDLSAWRIGAYGGAPMPEATIATLSDKLPTLLLSNAYGATETTSPTTIMPPAAGVGRSDSVGRVVSCGEVRVVDDDGRDVPPGQSGEILIKGPMVVPGYWNKPQATAENFTDGYWKSGDLGAIDAEGYVMVFDRKKDMINRGGYKIYSAEVENVLSYHPEVVESAAVPSPDPVLGERVHCFVLTKDGFADQASLKNHCAERMADYKVPDGFTMVDGPLPRNANGKLMKRLLVERLQEEMA